MKTTRKYSIALAACLTACATSTPSPALPADSALQMRRVDGPVPDFKLFSLKDVSGPTSLETPIRFSGLFQANKSGCPIVESSDDGSRYVVLVSRETSWDSDLETFVATRNSPVGRFRLDGVPSTFEGKNRRFPELQSLCGTDQALEVTVTPSSLDRMPQPRQIPMGERNDIGSLRECLIAQYPESYADLIIDWSDGSGYQLNMKGGIEPALCPTTLDIRVQAVDHSLVDLESAMNRAMAIVGGSIASIGIDVEKNVVDLRLDETAYASLKDRLDPFIEANPVRLTLAPCHSLIAYPAILITDEDGNPVGRPGGAGPC